MESFLNRYRNITVLLLVLFAQLILLAVQVKNDQDVRVIRIWTVTAITPFARVVEGIRGGSIGFIRNYFVLKGASEENRRLREEVGQLRMENNFLKNELATADRAKALQVFQSHTPSRTLAANVIGIGAGANSKVVFVNRGSVEGVMRGMAVVTPDGIVGKVIGAYPTASEVLLITDPEFAAGVISQKQQTRGTLKGQGSPLCKVDYVAYEDQVEAGEWFYTSGDDRIFPRGFAVGVVKSVRAGQPFKEILVEPSGLKHGLEDVLIVISGVHEDLPNAPVANQPVSILPPPGGPNETPASQPATAGTEADRLRGLYKSAGDAQGHTFGEGAPGSKPPDFTKLGGAPAPTGAAGRGNAPGAQATPPAGGRAPGSPIPTAPPAGTRGDSTGPAQPPGTPSNGRGDASGGRTPGSAPVSGGRTDSGVRQPAAGSPSGGRTEAGKAGPVTGGRAPVASGPAGRAPSVPAAGRTDASKTGVETGGRAPSPATPPGGRSDANKAGPGTGGRTSNAPPSVGRGDSSAPETPASGPRTPAPGTPGGPPRR